MILTNGGLKAASRTPNRLYIISVLGDDGLVELDRLAILCLLVTAASIMVSMVM